MSTYWKKLQWWKVQYATAYCTIHTFLLRKLYEMSFKHRSMIICYNDLEKKPPFIIHWAYSLDFNKLVGLLLVTNPAVENQQLLLAYDLKFQWVTITKNNNLLMGLIIKIGKLLIKCSLYLRSIHRFELLKETHCRILVKYSPKHLITFKLTFKNGKSKNKTVSDCSIFNSIFNTEGLYIPSCRVLTLGVPII